MACIFRQQTKHFRSVLGPRPRPSGSSMAARLRRSRPIPAATECRPCNKLSARLLCLLTAVAADWLLAKVFFNLMAPAMSSVNVCALGCTSVFCLLLPAIPMLSLRPTVRLPWGSRLCQKFYYKTCASCLCCLCFSGSSSSSSSGGGPFARSLFISQFVFNFCVTFLSIFVVLHTSDCQSLWWAVGGWRSTVYGRSPSGGVSPLGSIFLPFFE